MLSYNICVSLEQLYELEKKQEFPYSIGRYVRHEHGEDYMRWMEQKQIIQREPSGIKFLKNESLPLSDLLQSVAASVKALKKQSRCAA